MWGKIEICRTMLSNKNKLTYCRIDSCRMSNTRRLATFVERFVYKCFFTFTCDTPRGDTPRATPRAWLRLEASLRRIFYFYFFIKKRFVKNLFLFFKKFFFLMTSIATHVWRPLAKSLLWQGMAYMQGVEWQKLSYGEGSLMQGMAYMQCDTNTS